MNTQPELVITRAFQAPRELVFKAFTEAEHLVHWWGPKDFQLEVITLDVREGGLFHYSMANENGFKMWGVFKYHHVNSPQEIVFVNSFSDEQGNIIRGPFHEMWPLEVMNTWTFTEENSITTLTLKGKPHNATEPEINTFEAEMNSMNQGFGGTFNQLEAYLSRIQK